MSLAASQRRDQRRRLVLSWNRGDAPATPPSQPSRPLADYAPDALPERQPSLATLVPTGLGGLSLAAAGIVVSMAAATGVGLWETIAGGQLFARTGGRFALTLAAVGQCLDIRSLLSLGGWLAQVYLFVATAAALVVRLMRRHRRDDYRGRYRAWGWLACLFATTACAAHVPIGQVFGGLVADASGMAVGPAGIGWWLLAAGVLYASVGLWAVLPLHERTATAIWLSLALSAWAGSAGCTWLGAGRDLPLVVGNACWMAGAALAAVAMLAAARSVIREVRGLPARKAAPASTDQRIAKKATVTAPLPADDGESESRIARPDDRQLQATSYVDGSEADDDGDASGRHLSKAERKRLRKLARMNRAA